MKKKIVTFTNVIKIYSDGKKALKALDHVNLEFYEGEFIGIIGKSGSGKSTLLNMVSGIDFPTQGSVSVTEQDLSTLKPGKLTKWRCATAGIVFQSFHLIPTLTLAENIMLPMEFNQNGNMKSRRKRALELLEMVGLKNRGNEFPDFISGGEKQRVAIARALANDPPLILADEPTGNLDSQNSDQIFSLFSKLATEGKTVVMVTHERELIKQFSKTYLVQDGVVTETKETEKVGSY